MTDSDRDESSSARIPLTRRSREWFIQGIRWRLIACRRRALWLGRGLRWRIVSVSRKLQWLFRGLRWRIVSVSRKLQWLFRGLRWRVLGRWRKVGRFYRGIRWRVISRYRKALWFGRRRRRDLGMIRRRLIAAAPSGVRRCLTRFSLREQLFARPHLSSRGPALTRVLEAAGVSAAEAGRRATHRRVRSVVRDALVPSMRARYLTAELRCPTEWATQERDRVGAARSFTLDDSALPRPGLERLVALLPPLLSGRPLVEGGSLVAPVTTVDELRTLDEVERMHLSYRQLRSLFTSSPEWVPPRIAVVLCTNRPEFLPTAVAQIRSQAFVEIELVVGVHGSSGWTELGDLVGGSIVGAEIHEYGDHVVFGDVLGDLTARTSAFHVSKWDDDDFYGPHHLFDLWLLHTLSGAAMVGKAAEFVLLEDRDLVVRRRGGPILRESRFLAGGTLFFSRPAFDLAGGWRSIPRRVDQDLIARFARRGLRTFRGHGLEFVLTRRTSGHTWAAADSYFIAGSQEGWGRVGLEIAGVIESLAADSSVAVEMGSPVPTAICVPNKDNRHGLARLRALDGSFVGVDRIVVADDRSTPPLKVDGDSDRILVSRVPEGPGFGAGRARAHAAAQTSAGRLVFVDADVHLSPDALDEIGRLHSARPSAVHAVLGFSELDPATAAELVADQGLDALEAAASDRVIGGQIWREPYWAETGDLHRVRSASYRACVGGFVSVDAEAHAAAGGFRDVPVRGVEDIEFGYRLQATGCDQRLYRGPGVIHLGERTFSANLEGEEEMARNRWLTRLVPIWMPTLAERADQLAGVEEPIVPFLGCLGPVDGSDRPGPGVAISLEEPWDLLAGPFCVSVGPLTSDLTEALPEVYRLFRDGPSGEVAVYRGEIEVARVFALWAINRCLVLGGSVPWVDSTRAVPLGGADGLEGDIRDRFGVAFVVLDEVQAASVVPDA